MSPTANEATKSIEVFITYAPEDEKWQDILAKHLKLMQRKGQITRWYDGELLAEKKWEQEVIEHFHNAQIILILISTDFLVSFADNSFYHNEIIQALKRHDMGEAIVIPIILRSVDWMNTRFAALQALPRNGIPITRWRDRDEAFSDVAAGIRKVVEKLRATEQPSSTSTALIDKSAQELLSPPLPPVQNVPYSQNPFFTGREDILDRLYSTLVRSKTENSTPLQALIGLGGIGKTQIALAYAYRYSKNYQAILWAKADSRTTLISDFASIAGKLNLPEKDIQDQNLVVAAVKRWMEEHTDWLLILDNVNHLSTINDFIPTVSRGHILLTSQEPTTGELAQQVKINRMSLEESRLLLLRRAIAPTVSLTDVSSSNFNTVTELARILDGIPLALDLAGTYIKATNCDWDDYFNFYTGKRDRIRELPLPHPEPIAISWKLTFEQLRRRNPAAIDLLRLCTFLYSEMIPDEILDQGLADSNHLSTFVEVNRAKSELLNFSFLHYAFNIHAFAIHQRIQAMIKNEMDESEQRQWVKDTIRVVNRIFPTNIDFSAWSLCERYLPQVQTLASYIEKWSIGIPEAVQLLHHTAFYLKERTRYSQAVSLSTLALNIQEPDAPEMAQNLNNLAEIYRVQGKYSEAESLYQQALTIFIRTLGSSHPDVAQTFDNLALLYKEQGKYRDAEMFFLNALEIRERYLGETHPDVATSMNNLALIYASQGKYRDAERLFLQALEIRKQTLGETHPDVATSLNNLATLYNAQGKYNEAESHLKEALAIDESIYGLHPNIARDFNNLGTVLEAKGDLEKAQELYQQALSIDEKIYGPNHPNVSGDINNIGSIYRKLGYLEEAQRLYKRALDIDEQAYGPNHPNTAIRLNNLGIILQEQGNLQDAQQCYEQALAIVEATYGKNHPSAATIINNLASVLQTMDKTKEALALYERALTITVATYGPDHPDIGKITRNLNSVLPKKS